MADAYGAAAQVRAMLGRPDLSDEIIDAAARLSGWPKKDPHPFLVAENIESLERRRG